MITKAAAGLITPGNIVNAAFWGGMEVPGYLSGETNVGQAVGNAVGGMTGYALGGRVMDKVLPSSKFNGRWAPMEKMKSPFRRATNNFVAAKPASGSLVSGKEYAKGLGGKFLRGTGRMLGTMAIATPVMSLASGVLGKIFTGRREPNAAQYPQVLQQGGQAPVYY